jgi:hypothetical protein
MYGSLQEKKGGDASVYVPVQLEGSGSAERMLVQVCVRVGGCM